MMNVAIRTIEIHRTEFLKGVAPDAFIDWLGSKLVEFARAAMAGRDDAGFSYYMCSSTLDIACSSGWFDLTELCRIVRRGSGLRCSYSNAMQCASWGFVVRHHLVNRSDVRNLLVAIVDANPFAMDFWEENEFWGRTSQTVTLLHLELGDHRRESDEPAKQWSGAIVTGKCNPAAMLYDYSREIQKVMACHPRHTLAVPYFEGKMRKGIKRNIEAYSHLPDLYDVYGHLCGADPWMSIAHDRGGRTTEPRHYLASSIASEGYFCFLTTTADAQSKVTIEGWV
jgi:hypothetical protein